ncbi:MAG TPA: hypothetical protein VNN07_06775 [Candidatus Tectomicrobia bacterium]|nr:hypothetical protein [Candidatus Tectomicrobia bacterium]
MPAQYIGVTLDELVSLALDEIIDGFRRDRGAPAERRHQPAPRRRGPARVIPIARARHDARADT